MNTTDTETSPDSTKAQKANTLHNTTMAAYAAMGLGLVSSLALHTVPSMIGAAILLVGIVLVYARRGAARGSYLESHYRWMVRTFWIGGVFLALGAIVWTGYVVALAVDPVFLNSLGPDPSDADINRAVMHLMLNARTELILSQVPGTLWWCWRCIKGVRVLRQGQPIGKPADTAREAI